MISPELQVYVDAQRAVGKSAESIRVQLKTVGWSQNIIDEILPQEVIIAAIKPRPKLWILLVLVVLLVLGGCVYGYYRHMRLNTQAAQATSPSVTGSPTNVADCGGDTQSVTAMADAIACYNSHFSSGTSFTYRDVTNFSSIQQDERYTFTCTGTPFDCLVTWDITTNSAAPAMNGKSLTYSMKNGDHTVDSHEFALAFIDQALLCQAVDHPSLVNGDLAAYIQDQNTQQSFVSSCASFHARFTQK